MGELLKLEYAGRRSIWTSPSFPVSFDWLSRLKTFGMYFAILLNLSLDGISPHILEIVRALEISHILSAFQYFQREILYLGWWARADESGWLPSFFLLAACVTGEIEVPIFSTGCKIYSLFQRTTLWKSEKLFLASKMYLFKWMKGIPWADFSPHRVWNMWLHCSLQERVLTFNRHICGHGHGLTGRWSLFPFLSFA